MTTAGSDTADPSRPHPQDARAGERPTGSLPDTPSSAGRLLRTAGLVTVIASMGSLLGLVRDATIAGSYGASSATDAFFVAWTIPETASPLLLQEALTYLLIPVLSRELVRHGSVQRVVDRTFVPALLLLAVLTGLVALAAPLITHLLAPGLEDPAVAITCVRIASLTVFFLGITGYLTATLQATGSFVVPAWVYIVYNLGIVAAILVLADRMGIYAAAIGLALGSAGMATVQLVPFLRRASMRRLHVRFDRRVAVALLMFLPVAAYTLGRQGQVYVERIIASDLGPGAISQLNFASKTGQMAILLTSVVAAVAFPGLARHAAADRTDELRTGVERTLRLGALLVLPLSAALVVFAPETIGLLFQRGAFDAADTAATTDILRLYSTGLVGQTVVNIAVLCFFSAGARTWYPALAAGGGLVATVLVDILIAPVMGAPGLALGNAAGITFTAVVLLLGIRRRVVEIRWARLADLLWRATLAAGLAAAAGWGAIHLLPAHSANALVLFLGGSLLLVTFVAAAAVLGVAEIREARRAVGARLRLRRRTGP